MKRFFEMNNNNVDQEEDMYVWGFLVIEITLEKNVILHNKMYMNHTLGFVGFVTLLIEWKQWGLVWINFLYNLHISPD